MNEKVNIAELLKDCPKGMELYSPIFGKVYLDKIRHHLAIVVTTDKEQGGFKEEFLYDGRYGMNGECMLYPSKGKTTWEGFVPPCKFKDGDVVTNITGAVFIYKEITTYGYCGSFVSLDRYNQLILHYESYLTDCIRLSTEEEKEKLFKAIKDNGYKWNAKTNTLVELPKFHEGDWIMIDKPCKIITIIDNGNYIVQYCDDEKTHLLTKKFCESHFHLWTIQDAKDGDVLFHSDSASNGIFIFKEISQRGTTQKVICYCDYDSEDGFCLGENHTCCWADCKILHPATKEKRDILFQKMKKAGYEWKPETKTLNALTKPKFKVGDRIERFGCRYTITEIRDNYYLTKCGDKIRIDNQDVFELAPNKFDVTTLKPFDKVLVRTKSCWTIDFFDGYQPEIGGDFTPFGVSGGKYYQQCIPYEGNEHLRATTNDCDEYYKNW